MTESERIFERFCGESGLKLRKIPEGKARTPDYYMEVRDRTLVVEVKQIDANSEERRLLLKDPEEWGQNEVFHWDIPGERLRNKIASAMPQLRSLSKGIYPALVVVYDNIKVWPELTDECAARVAMYGIETAIISREVAPEGGARILKRWYGPRKRATVHHNTTLSAVAVITEEENRIVLSVYHNWYAGIPLEKQTLTLPGVDQFELEQPPSAHFCNWKRLVP